MADSLNGCSVTSSSSKKSATKTGHRRALALIAAGCALLVFLLAHLPDLLVLDRNGQGFGARLIRKYPSLSAFDRAEDSGTDLLQYYGRKAALDPRIVFLALDTPSFEQSSLTEEERQHPALKMLQGGMPLPRSFYPLVLQRLVDAGAKVVMLDILFTSAKPEDEVFRAALEKYRDHVVIGSNLQIGVQINGGSMGVIAAPAETLIPEDDRLFDSRVGFVNFKPDYEIVRRVQYRANILEYFGENPEDLGVNAEGADRRELLSLTAQGARKAGFGSSIPPGEARLPFRFVDGLDQQFHSLSDIFVPTLWEKNFRHGEFFKDKLVFIGPYGNWSKDELQTPFGPMLGPELHVSALNALLKKEYLKFPSRDWDVVLVLLAGAIAMALGWTIADPVRRSLALLGTVVLYVALAFVCYNLNGQILTLLSPTVTLLSGGFIGLVWERVLEAERERAHPQHSRGLCLQGRRQ